MRSRAGKNAAGLFGLTAGALAILGYHPGLEDDAFYLAAIKLQLNPALYPHDADYFRLQFQATLFDSFVAGLVRLTHLPLASVALALQCAAVFAILTACLRIASHCFEEIPARWSATALVAALLTIPVSGTGIALVDQHLHPRTLATACILWALAFTLERRWWFAFPLLAAAASMHVIMAAFGVSCCLFLGWRAPLNGFALLLPLGWLFDPTTPAWRKAAATRTFYYPLRWEWYEWLGIIAPVLLLWLFSRARGLRFIAARLAAFAVFQFIVAMAIMLPPAFERLRPFEPLRYLQLVYLFLFLLMGGLAGRYLLKAHIWRWALLFAPLSFGMAYAQCELYPSTPHFEWPWAAPATPWTRTFAWIAANTPRDSYFALNPLYIALPGEDAHGFRALAERSVLADNLKDPGIVARVPRLAPRWLAESEAQSGWNSFTAADFRRLKSAFGVGWVVLDNPAVSAAGCLHREGTLRVCRIN